MPTYDYECRECGKVFEVFHSIKADPLTDCDCGEKGALKRLIGAGAGIIFKGSGFYETDYRSDDYKKRAKADKQAASGTSSSKKDTKNGGDSEAKKTDKAASTAKTADAKA